MKSLLEIQIEKPEGIRWGELLEFKPIKKSMARRTFAKALRRLVERGLVKKEKIKNRRGNPVLYSINPKLFAELCEIRSMFFPWIVEDEIERFKKDIEPLDTQKYVEAIMGVALSRLIVLAISLMFFKTEGRWALYEAVYVEIEQLLKCILDRALKSKKEKKQALSKLFEILEAFADIPIGKRFGLDEICRVKKEIIKLIVNKENA